MRYVIWMNKMKKDKCDELMKKSTVLIKLLMELLPNQPRSFDTADDPGFWTNGNEILCPTELECEILADFLEDVLREVSITTVKTGCYDPYEDARNGEQDDNTGFYYIDFE